jgi:hypothetical protein
VTLDLHLRARGLTAAQLPDLNSLLSLPEGVKAYPDQAKLSNDTKSETLVGERDQSIALIADRAGDFSIPPLTVRWWDTASNQPREVTLAARTLSFAPPDAVASANPSPASSASSAAAPSRPQPAVTAAPAPGRALNEDARVWRAVGLLLGLLWILTLIAWYVHGRRRRDSAVSELQDPGAAPRLDGGEARAQLLAACRANDARAARAALIRWIAASTGAHLNLREFARRAKDSRLTALLSDLDRACYRGIAWNGATLLGALSDFPALFREPEPKQREELAALYR